MTYTEALSERIAWATDNMNRSLRDFTQANDDRMRRMRDPRNDTDSQYQMITRYCENDARERWSEYTYWRAYIYACMEYKRSSLATIANTLETIESSTITPQGVKDALADMAGYKRMPRTTAFFYHRCQYCGKLGGH